MSHRRSVNRIPGSVARDEPALPPFWELEDLVSSGADREAALAVMAARRARPMLIGSEAFRGPLGTTRVVLRSRFGSYSILG